VTAELEAESAKITLSMPASRLQRPFWDLTVMEQTGFRAAGMDDKLGQRVLQEHDLPDAPLFLVWGKK